MSRSFARGCWRTFEAMKLGDIVKYSKPQDGEADFRFILLDDPSDLPADSQRVSIKLICDWPLPPIETVHISEIALA